MEPPRAGNQLDGVCRWGMRQCLNSFGGLAHQEERLFCTQKAVGSSPTSSTNYEVTGNTLVKMLSVLNRAARLIANEQ